MENGTWFIVDGNVPSLHSDWPTKWSFVSQTKNHRVWTSMESVILTSTYLVNKLTITRSPSLQYPWNPFLVREKPVWNGAFDATTNNPVSNSGGSEETVRFSIDRSTSRINAQTEPCEPLESSFVCWYRLTYLFCYPSLPSFSIFLTNSIVLFFLTNSIVSLVKLYHKNFLRKIIFLVSKAPFSRLRVLFFFLSSFASHVLSLRSRFLKHFDNVLTWLCSFLLPLFTFPFYYFSLRFTAAMIGLATRKFSQFFPMTKRRPKKFIFYTASLDFDFISPPFLSEHFPRFH